jgi:hypothetical protein
MPSTFETIATTTVSGTPATITFSSIPQTYTDIYCTVYTPTTAGVNLNINFNGDTGSNYNWVQIYGEVGFSTPATHRASNSATALFGVSDGLAAIHGHIMNYSNATTNKTFLVRGGGNRYVDLTACLWRNNAAITSITIGPSWSTGSIVTLYGIKAA